VLITKIDDPRIEAEEHYYHPDCEKLRALGFNPTRTLDDELEIMLSDLKLYEDRIRAKRDRIMPKPYWKQ